MKDLVQAKLPAPGATGLPIIVPAEVRRSTLPSSERFCCRLLALGCIAAVFAIAVLGWEPPTRLIWALGFVILVVILRTELAVQAILDGTMIGNLGPQAQREPDLNHLTEKT